MAVNICLTDFRNAVREVINNNDADAIMDDLNNRADHHMRLRNLDKATALGQSIDDFVAERKLEARLKQIQYKATALKMADAENQIEGFKDYSEGLASFFTGTELRGDKSRLSVAGNTKTRVADVLGFFLRELDKRGVAKAFENKELDDLSAKERAGIDTKNDQAKQVAEAVNEAYKYVSKKFNLEHVYIANAEGYIAKTTHNVDRMLSPTGKLSGDVALRVKGLAKHFGDFHKVDQELHEVAYKRWLETIRPKTDEEKTFKTVKPGNEEKFFRGMFEHLTTGIRKDLPNEEGAEILKAHRRSYNLADKLNAKRVWHPADADAWIDYNKVYGHGSFHDTVLSQLEQTADALGLVQKMGANPANFADRLIKKYEQVIFRDQKPAGAHTRMNAIKRYVDYKLKPQTRMMNGLGSKIVQGIKMTRYFQLGGLLVRSLPDANTMALRMAKYEGNYATSSAKIAQSFLSGMPSDEAKNVAMALRLYANGSMGAQLSRFGNPDLGYGFVAKMLMKQDKLSLMNRWDNTGRWAVGKVISHRMGGFVGDSYNKIPEDIRKELMKYGIDKDLWSLVGKYKRNLIKAEGEHYFTPDVALNISKEDIARKWYGNKTGSTSDLRYEQAKSEIHNRLMNFFHDQVSYGKMFPNDSDYAYLKLVTPNSPFLGGLVKLLTMFKSFDVAMTRRTWGSFLHSEGGDSVWKNLAIRKYDVGKFLLGGMAMGNLSYTAGELLRGKVPDYSKVSTWLKIAFAGSVGGLAAGFAEGMMDANTGGDIAKSLAGPGIGSMINLYQKGKSALKFNQGSMPALMNLVQHNAPFTSLFYVKPILDKYIMGSVNDYFDPTHTQKARERIRSRARKSGEHVLWLPNQ